MPIRLSSLPRPLAKVLSAFVAAVGRMDKSLSPSDTIARLRKHTFTLSDSIYVFHLALAAFWITLMQFPPFPYKLLIPILNAIFLLIPLTSQFFLPAIPVASWVLTFYSSRFIPASWRPSISVSLLPTLETVLYGANVSDILTRTTHPVLDIIAWLPYGIIHFVFPFVVAAFLWLFRPKEALHLWARAFGYMNLIGVIIQILIPCAAPWYELIYGLTPANYSMPGSAGGLGRIDALFGGHGYETTFSHSPVVFGAFPSLHAGCATIEALFISQFFPEMTKYIWAYAGVLYWATMYLTHHYLIDVVSGACLATACFYFFLPDEFRGPRATAPPASLGRRSKYDLYDVQNSRGRVADMDEFELSSEDEEGADITYRSPVPGSNNAPLQQQQKAVAGKKSHRHTASIASLIRAEERVEDGWSPIMGSFAFPPNSPGRDRERADERV